VRACAEHSPLAAPFDGKNNNIIIKKSNRVWNWIFPRIRRHAHSARNTICLQDTHTHDTHISYNNILYAIWGTTANYRTGITRGGGSGGKACSFVFNDKILLSAYNIIILRETNRIGRAHRSNEKVWTFLYALVIA